MSGIFEGLAVEAIWNSATALIRRLAGRQIQITSPRTGEILGNPEPRGEVVSYRVDGTLGHLPRDQAIWLLTEEEVSGRVWPQGFYAVEFDRKTKKWHGRIILEGINRIKIHAVVAPPTSQDFFRYYEQVGQKTGYAPLGRIPTECVNKDNVQARL